VHTETVDKLRDGGAALEASDELVDFVGAEPTGAMSREA